MILSMVFAFLVLVFTTFNIVISLYSVLTIGGILASIIAFIYMIGWELGVTESVAMVIFVGFSVDYVVHMAHQYVECVHDSKRERVNSSFQNIGVTLLSSCLTTYSSGLFLMFTTMYTLYKFGILIQLTILIAMIYSLVFFPALNYIIGPQNKFGDLLFWVWRPLVSKVRHCMKNNREKALRKITKWQNKEEADPTNPKRKKNTYAKKHT
jgi:predicted RND superfamily exporter protein